MLKGYHRNVRRLLKKFRAVINYYHPLTSCEQHICHLLISKICYDYVGEILLERLHCSMGEGGGGEGPKRIPP